MEDDFVVKVPCTKCGEVKVPARDVELYHWIELDSYTYSSKCSKCGGRESHPIRVRKILSLLLKNGFEPIELHVPAELYEAHMISPMSSDEILDMFQAIDALEELER